jgi:hypothetical protein
MASRNPSQPDHTADEVITRDQLDAWFALLFAHPCLRRTSPTDSKAAEALRPQVISLPV